MGDRGNIREPLNKATVFRMKQKVPQRLLAAIPYTFSFTDFILVVALLSLLIEAHFIITIWSLLKAVKELYLQKKCFIEKANVAYFNPVYVSTVKMC